MLAAGHLIVAVALDRAEAAATEIVLDDSGVIGLAAVPVEDDDVARARVPVSEPLSAFPQPIGQRRHVGAAVRRHARGAGPAAEDDPGADLEAVGEENGAPRLTVGAEPAAELCPVRAGRILPDAHEPA